MHIPKSGGASFSNYLKSCFDVNDTYINRRDKIHTDDFHSNKHRLSDLEFFAAHCRIYELGEITGGSCDLRNAVTILRHPIDQLISLYRWEFFRETSPKNKSKNNSFYKDSILSGFQACMRDTNFLGYSLLHWFSKEKDMDEALDVASQMNILWFDSLIDSCKDFVEKRGLEPKISFPHVNFNSYLVKATESKQRLVFNHCEEDIEFYNRLRLMHKV